MACNSYVGVMLSVPNRGNNQIWKSVQIKSEVTDNNCFSIEIDTGFVLRVTLNVLSYDGSGDTAPPT